MKNAPRIFALALSLALFAFPLAAGVSFDGAALNESDELLFTVRQDIPGAPSYQSAFYAALANGDAVSAPRPITCYPERMELLSGGNVLQVRNRYGTARYSLLTKRLEWIDFAKEIPLDSMRLAPYSASPDGKWICRVNKTGFVTGELVVEDAATGRQAILNPNEAFSYERVPVKWSRDGSLVLYGKNGKLFFCSPDALLRGIEADERYREIGQGNINSACWAGSDVFYVDGDMVHRIKVREMYATGLYADVIGKGTPCGRLPERFDARRDMFFVDAGGASLFLIKSGKIFSYYLLKSGSPAYVSVVFSRPYINSEGSLLDAAVLWSASGEPFVWMRIVPYSGGKTQAAVYRITDSFVPVLTVENSRPPVVSADASVAAFFSGETVYVYNVSAWRKIAELSGEEALNAVWRGNDTLYIGGSHSVRAWNVAGGSVETLFLSSANSCAWDGANGRAIVASGGIAFSVVNDFTVWNETSETANVNAFKPSVQNGRYRVFSGTTESARFDNALYVRTLSGRAVTRALFPESVAKTPKRKKAALAFDAYDNADGLAKILSTLDVYGIRGTFFLNGEFIRRYPDETRQIALSGNRCASLFFTALDLTGGSFIVNESFVRRGLARNEDEFYSCTGTELSLLWHAPFYRVSDSVRGFGEKAGYKYADAVNGGKGDTTIEDALVPSDYMSAAQIIEAHLTALNKNGGGIVPVTVGFSRGTRTDYVYQNLDLLVSAILDGGFDIVNAEELAN